MTATAAHQEYRRAIEADDADAVKATFAENIVLNSPVTPKPFEGRDACGFVLQSVMEVFEGLHFVDELVGEDHVALVFRATVGGKELEGLDYLHFDADGKIDEFTVMIRPLTGLVALQNEMAARFGAKPVTLASAA